MVLEIMSQISKFFTDISNLPIMSYTFLNNTVFSYLIAVIVFFISLTVLRTIKYVIIRYLKMLCKKTKNDIDDMLMESVCNQSSLETL